MGSMQHGTVKWFNEKKGFGFITGADGVDVFVHYSGIAGSGFRTLKERQRVSYKVVDGQKGEQAVEVQVEA